MGVLPTFLKSHIHYYIHIFLNLNITMAGTPPMSPNNSGSDEPRATSVEATTPPRTTVVTSVGVSGTPATPPRSVSASSSTTTPPQTQPVTVTVSSSGAGSSSNPPLTPSKRKDVFCPICNKNMFHEKAFCGHIRWHTQAQRDANSAEIQRTLALSRQVDEAVRVAKKIKIPDLNELPKPEDDDEDAEE